MQNNRHSIFFVPCCGLPLPEVSVCCLLKLSINWLLYSQYSILVCAGVCVQCVCAVCVLVRVCVCAHVRATFCACVYNLWHLLVPTKREARTVGCFWIWSLDILLQLYDDIRRKEASEKRICEFVLPVKHLLRPGHFFVGIREVQERVSERIEKVPGRYVDDTLNISRVA